MGVLLKVKDEEGNVVLLSAGGIVAGKRDDAIEKDVGESRGRNVAVRAARSQRRNFLMCSPTIGKERGCLGK